MNAQISKLSNDGAKTQADSIKHLQEIEKLKKSLSEKSKASTDSLNHLEKQMSELRTEKSNLMAKVATLETAKNELSNKVKTLDEEKNRINAENKDLQSKVKKAAPAVSTSDQTKFQKEITDLKKERDELSKSVKTYEKDKVSWQKQSSEDLSGVKKEMCSIKKDKDNLSQSLKVVERDLKKVLKDIQPKKVTMFLICTGC